MPDISQSEPIFWFGLLLAGIALRLLWQAARRMSPEQAARLLEELRRERQRLLQDAANLELRHAQGMLEEQDYTAACRQHQRQLSEISSLCSHLSLTFNS